jgi:hypothetical protein
MFLGIFWLAGGYPLVHKGKMGESSLGWQGERQIQCNDIFTANGMFTAENAESAEWGFWSC